MIVSPRAAEVTDILRIEGNDFIEIDEVFLYRRNGAGSPYRKTLYWERTQSFRRQPQQRPLPPVLQRSFAIVPEMTAAMSRGSIITGNTLNDSEAINAWRAFDRSALTEGSFGTFNANSNGNNRYAWAIATFQEPRIVRSWSLQFEYAWGTFHLAIEGLLEAGNWVPFFESSAMSPINHGRFGATTTPVQCVAVRILTNHSSLVRSCQFFDCVPLVPVSLTSNFSEELRMTSEHANHSLYRCFTEQSNAYPHGTAAWYYNEGDWQSNREEIGGREHNRFTIQFAGSALVRGFSVGGLSNFFPHFCYANCLLIEGLDVNTGFWRPLREVNFEPAERRTRYFDLWANRTVSGLRITVQDVTHPVDASADTPVYLPPMQAWGGIFE
jgi:hypothetical protein